MLAIFVPSVALTQVPVRLPSPAPSQPEPPTMGAKSEPIASEEVAAALNHRGDLNLHGLSLNNALFTISEQWNVNIVAGDLQGTVNGVFKQAPLREILDSILLSNGYNYRAVGESLVISSVDSLGSSNSSFESATIPVLSADIDEVVEGARLLLTPQGKAQALKSARAIVVLDFPDRVQMVRRFVRTLEQEEDGRVGAPGSQRGLPLEVAYFHTQYITAKAAEQALVAVLSKSGRVGVLEKEDRLLVSDYADNLAMVEKVLKEIDRPRPQVRITALIYDISLQDIEQLGINWANGTAGGSAVSLDGDGVRSRNTALDVDSIMQVPFTPGAVGSAFTLSHLSRHIDLSAVVLALSTANDARLMGNPNVAVLENDDAIFQSVSEIPFQQLTQTSAGGQIGTTAFKEAGITLRVRPKIAVDGTIEMMVTPEFSRLAGFTPGDNQPIIDKRTATTVLRVCDRQIVVIGGLRQRSDVGDFKGVPYLKDIPGIGRAFRSRDTDVRESELVVFIMPEIVAYGDAPRPRDQMIADTINCRLEQIPLPEGCPPPCQPMSCPPGVPVVEPLGMTSEARLRRLPSVQPDQPTIVDNPGPTNLFPAPPSRPAQAESTARRPLTTSVR
jgi:general secretion pathway protein D